FPLDHITPRPAAKEEILFVHTDNHFTTIQQTAGREYVMLDPDTSTCAKSFDTALLAAGGAIEAADAVMSGDIKNAFALIRPPGHHAEAGRAMGFCLFNNIAIAAEHLLRVCGCQKILIVDWDLHHGNGTQHSFEHRPDVLYFSTHQFPHYPGTGHWTETGKGDGAGFTLNVPLSPGKDDQDYRAVFHNILRPVCLSYAPDIILVSAGFDIHIDDPLGGMRVSETGFGALTRELMDMADCTCNGKLLFILEGGYNLFGQSRGVQQVLQQLAGHGQNPDSPSDMTPLLEQELQPVIRTVDQYWKL
ncbi:MAG: histone deacetylase, partial [Candidatus Aminicenantes bacterium]|nr:histone deacetylase [Candidatus Aminicenantes bacterium]